MHMFQTVYVQLCDFQHFCTRLKTLTDEESGKLHIRRDKATDVPEVGCFIEVMDAFFKVVGLHSVYLTFCEEQGDKMSVIH